LVVDWEVCTQILLLEVVVDLVEVLVDFLVLQLVVLLPIILDLQHKEILAEMELLMRHLIEVAVEEELVLLVV
tara:strand:- start:242 stop:460 length:219 start_codon:yes stop_codon:yes gene_type:complete